MLLTWLMPIAPIPINPTRNFIWRKLKQQNAATPRLSWSACESQRDSATKPRVARDELPWVKADGVSQPQRPMGLRPCCVAIAVGRNPFRVVIDRSHDPRVARPWQPWALLQNPFGIRHYTIIIYGMPRTNK